jgi:hypothetical protein
VLRINKVVKTLFIPKREELVKEQKKAHEHIAFNLAMPVSDVTQKEKRKERGRC